MRACVCMCACVRLYVCACAYEVMNIDAWRAGSGMTWRELVGKDSLSSCVSLDAIRESITSKFVNNFCCFLINPLKNVINPCYARR